MNGGLEELIDGCNRSLVDDSDLWLLRSNSRNSRRVDLLHDGFHGLIEGRTDARVDGSNLDISTKARNPVRILPNHSLDSYRAGPDLAASTDLLKFRVVAGASASRPDWRHGRTATCPTSIAPHARRHVRDSYVAPTGARGPGHRVIGPGELYPAISS